MTAKLYTVTLNAFANYQTTVAADTPNEAKSIAKDLICMHLMSPPKLVQHVSTEIDAPSADEANQPVRKYKVHGIYQINFDLTVPANSSEEAELHAMRIYTTNCGPFEFEHDGGNLERLRAEEVRS